MSSQYLLIEQRERRELRSHFKKMIPHIELITALCSGGLILIGWILDRMDVPSSFIFFVLAFIIGGFFKAKEGIKDTIQDRELNVEMLMIFAAIGSALIGYWTEGAILIFIFAISGALETYTMNKSHAEISALMDIQPQQALRINKGVEETVHITALLVGDHIVIKPGERVPADGKIIKGQTTIDESAITGEAIPVTKLNHDEVFAGTVNMNGSIIVEITKEAHETLFQKIIELVQTAQSEKSPSQLFIERFEGTYVKVVLLVVLLMMFLPYYVLGWSWTDTFYRAMVLLVVASPCALVASIMPATLSAISTGAKRGILFKGGVHLENLAHLKAIAFDKTGTLTQGKPVVTNITIHPDYAEEDILPIVASIENQSNHPLAQAIVRYVKENNQVQLITPDLLEDVSGWGVKAIVNGQKWKIGKADFIKKDARGEFGVSDCETWSSEGKSIVYVAKESKVVACIALKDIIRNETIDAIKMLRTNGIYTVMLTGDSGKTARAIAEETSVDEYIADCLPEIKVAELKKLMVRYGPIGMVGDGINDAPALATANVGIAMGEGTDVALETADIILIKNDLPKIAEAIRLSKRMQKIVKQNIIFSIGVIFLLIISNFLQVLDLPIGVIGHEGSTILVILNGLRMLKN
ncbi:heavy metal translocating P-type ATPase [Bacillus spongiae]|uniref:Heavy metal translocating P-type ATPase n=1 Tax=Bacillus spongiae TaxID=2683610 RepID=A0ABU8HH37_9BACI